MSVALVTGGTRGIGLAVAKGLVRAGHTAIITGRSPATVRAVCASVAPGGGLLDGVSLDVTDPESIASAASRISDTYGRLDILINNAGILPEAHEQGPSQFASVEVFRQTFETNVFGVVAVTEAFLPLLRAGTAGRIVNVSSTLGSLHSQSDPSSPWYPMMVPAYQTSKAAVNSITIALSKKLADESIVVTSVCPGWAQTDLAPGNHEQAPLTADEAAGVVIEAALAPDGTPSGRFVDASGPVRW
jgi:NAD(P)-dependent dehydrogenase (short-subunit alcohol dehydrogenase family)